MANGKVPPKDQLVACQVFRQCHGHRTLSAGKKLLFFYLQSGANYDNTASFLEM